ncbi:MAG: Hpt domain-containing protein, partial [Leptolyngbyaceae cyanobacterium]
MQSEQQQRIMGYFIEEAKDHLGTIEKGLLNLQSTMADAEMIGEVFRAAHSVKGGAAMLGLDSIQKTSHRLEDYFKVLKECPVQVDQKLETLLLRVFDTLQDLLGHLQGPFGLTDEKSDEVMAEVEPVFGQLNAHLSTLVTHSGGDKPVDVDLSPHSAVTARPAIDEAAALKRFFQKDVAAELRNLLGLFKQADTTESRQQLQDICRALDQQGEAVGASQAWGELLDTSKRAIAHPDNSYRQLAPVIIKTLKQAQTLGAANRCPDIEVSEALLKLCPAVVEEAIAPTRSVDAMETEDLNDLGYGHSDVVSDAFGLDSGEFFSDSSADQPNDQPNDSFGDSSFGDSSFGDSFDNLDNNNDNIDDSDVASLFGDSFADSADADDEVDLADSLDLIDTLDVAEETSPGADPSDTNTNVDNLLDALDAQGDSAHHQRVGPQVGPEAMDSLADLFDSESSQNLSFDWSEENTGVAEPDELSDDLALDALNDFSDLLDDDTLGSSADFSTSEDDISAILNTFDHDEMPLAEPSQTDVGMDMGETATADDPLGLATDIEAEGLDNLFDQAPLASDNLLAEDSSSGLFEDTASATDALDGETDTNQTTDELLITPEEEGDRSFDSEIDASELDNLGAFFAGQEEADFGDVDSPLDTGSPAPELLPDEFDGLFADMAEVEGLEPEQTLAGMDFNDNIGSGADREINSDANRRADDDIWGEPTSTTLGTEDMGEDIDLSDPWADSIATDGQPEPLGSETSPQAIALDLTTGPESDAVDDLFGTDDPTSQNSNTDLEIDDDTLNDASLFDDDTLNDASLFDDDFDTPADPFAELDTPLGDNPFEDSPFEDNALDSSMAMPAIASNQAVTATESLEPDFDFGQDTSLSSEATNRVDNLDGSLASDGNTNDSDILDSLFGAPAMVSAGDQSEDQIFENPGEEGLADSFEDSLTERPTFEDEADFWLDQEAEASRDELSGDEPSTTAEGSGESDDLGFDLGLDLGLTADPFTEQSNELLSESVSPDLASPDLASPDLASPDLASSEQAGVDQEDAFGFLDDLADDNAGDALDLEGMEDMEGLGFDDEAIASPSTAPTSADPTETPFDIDLDLAEATDLPDNLVGDLADNLAEHPITDSFDLDNDDNIWADESSSTGQDDFDLAVQSSPSSDDVLSAEDDLGLNLDETEFSADAGLSADVVPSANNNDDLGLGLDEVDHSTDAVLSLEDDLGLGLDESDFSADAALSPDVVLSADDDLSLGLDESDFNAEAVLSLEDDLGLGLNESDFSPDAALSPDEDLGLDLNETDLKTEDVPNPEDALGFGLDEVDSSIDAALSPDDLGLASEDALGFGLDEVDSSIDAALSPDGDISTDNDLGLGLGESDFSLDPALSAEDDLGLGLDEADFSLDGSPSPDAVLSAEDDLGLGLDEADFSLD